MSAPRLALWLLALAALTGCAGEMVPAQPMPVSSPADAQPDPQTLAQAIAQQRFDVLESYLQHGGDIDRIFENGRTLLRLAVSLNKLETAAFLLKAGADPNRVLPEGGTVLHETGNLHMLRLLLAHGGDPNLPDRQGMTPFSSAVKKNLFHLVQYLLSQEAKPISLRRPEAGSNRPAEAMPIIFLSDKPGMIRLLADGGAETRGFGSDGRSLLEALEDLELIRYLVAKGLPADTRNREGATALHLAQRPEKAQLLLELGADPTLTDQGGNSALHQAAFDGREEVLRMLIARQQSQAAESFKALLDTPNGNGYTLLHAAISSRQPGLAGWLWKLGANPELRTNAGDSALKLAISSDRELAFRLIEAGVNLDLADQYGRTALSTAASLKAVGLVEALLAQGADAGKVDQEGIGPLYHAASLRRPDLLSQMLTAGADPDQAATNGRNPLEIAIDSRHLPSIKALVEGGAKVYLYNRFRRGYPISQAAAGGRLEILSYLLEMSGPNLSLSMLKAALQSAQAARQQDIVRLLEAKIAAFGQAS